MEQALKTHPAVYDCLVVAVPDGRFGESVAALILINPGASLDEASVKAQVRAMLADYKAPRHYI